MWIVAEYIDYYPNVHEFSNYEEALAFYEEVKAKNTFDGEYLSASKYYLAEVKDSIGSR